MGKDCCERPYGNVPINDLQTIVLALETLFEGVNWEVSDANTNEVIFSVTRCKQVHTEIGKELEIREANVDG